MPFETIIIILLGVLLSMLTLRIVGHVCLFSLGIFGLAVVAIESKFLGMKATLKEVASLVSTTQVLSSEQGALAPERQSEINALAKAISSITAGIDLQKEIVYLDDLSWLSARSNAMPFYWAALKNSPRWVIAWCRCSKLERRMNCPARKIGSVRQILKGLTREELSGEVSSTILRVRDLPLAIEALQKAL